VFNGICIKRIFNGGSSKNFVSYLSQSFRYVFDILNPIVTEYINVHNNLPDIPERNIMNKIMWQYATNEICSKSPLVSKTNLRKHFETVYDEASSMKVGFVDRKPWQGDLSI
jgi:hypothetical protein